MLKEFLSNLANAFREKLGTTDKINAQDFSNKVAEVYEAGKQAEYDAFWDSYQQNSKRVNYSNAFGGVGWTDELFKPKYDVNIADAYMTFRGTQITDLTNTTVKINIKPNGVQYTFQYATQLTHIGVIDLSNVTVRGLDSTFYGCNSLQTIDKIILSKNVVNTFGATFTGCTALKNIIIEGIIENDFNIKDAPLTKDSITSIINALSPTVSGKTVTFNKNAVNTAFETAEGLGDGSTSAEWLALRATKENWTVTLV